MQAADLEGGNKGNHLTSPKEDGDLEFHNHEDFNLNSKPM